MSNLFHWAVWFLFLKQTISFEFEEDINPSTRSEETLVARTRRCVRASLLSCWVSCEPVPAKDISYTTNKFPTGFQSIAARSAFSCACGNIRHVWIWAVFESRSRAVSCLCFFCSFIVPCRQANRGGLLKREATEHPTF